MQIVYRALLAALGLGAAFTVVWGVADPMETFAEVRVIEADGYYIMGDGPEENAAVAKERARADARRAASEQAGLYVAGMTEVKKGKLIRDEIRTGLQQGNRVLPQGHRACLEVCNALEQYGNRLLSFGQLPKSRGMLPEGCRA